MWDSIVDYIVYDLHPYVFGEYNAVDFIWWQRRFEVFDANQKKVVARWLALVLEHEDIFQVDAEVGLEAYEKYWKSA